MKSSLTEIVDIQNTVISLQSGAINELFGLLMEHMSAEEADGLPAVSKINTAAQLRRELEN